MSDEQKDELEEMTLWGVPVVIEDSPLTRWLGYYFVDTGGEEE